jgi:hypothetical protein
VVDKMEITYYDHHFNENEWFVLLTLVGSYILATALPRRFSRLETLVYFLFGIYIVNFFDHAISLEPFNFYDVNDNSSFQFFDFLSYIMFGPFSYFFIYVWDKLKLKIKYLFIYVLVWTLASLVAEWIASQLGVFHYKGSFSLYYSAIIYLLVQTISIGLYYTIKYHSGIIHKQESDSQ